MMWARPDRHDIQIKMHDNEQITLIHIILLHQNLFVSSPTSRYADFHAIRCWFDKVLMYVYDVLITPLKENVSMSKRSMVKWLQLSAVI